MNHMNGPGCRRVFVGNLAYSAGLAVEFSHLILSGGGHRVVTRTLLVTSATLVVTGALLVVTRSY